MNEVDVKLTGEEVDVLLSALDVLLNGGGTYSMINVPQIVTIHRSIQSKLENSKK